jgi:putative addiction module component (TIGR02574 family)
VAISAKTLGIDRLGIEDRLALVDEIWASICADASTFPLTDAQRLELDRRIADDDARPGEVVSWDEVRTSLSRHLTTK